MVLTGATTSGFSMGTNTFEVSMNDLFFANRSRLISLLYQLVPKKPFVIFLHGGRAETRYDSDHEPIFRQESYFWYLSGVKEPDCSIGITSNEKTILFVPRLPDEYATIMGSIRTKKQWREHYHVDQVRYTDELDDFWQEYDTPTTVLLLDGVNSDSGKRYKPPTDLPNNNVHLNYDTTTLFPYLADSRVKKSPAEQLLLRYVTEVTSFAHAYVMRNIQPGDYEYQAESLFRHYCYYNYGCRLVSYTPICGCGPSGAILHYGHAGEPNARQSKASDMCLFDMGAEYFCYGSDVTCSFPISGTFSAQQRLIYQAVLNAQIAVFKMMKPFVSFVDCHKAAEKEIIKGLIDAGIVVLNHDSETPIDDLVEMRLGAVFMPHGLGHFIGIDTHDVGGYLSGHTERILQPGLKSLRTARLLHEDMVMTVEPGCYFIEHLLDKALKDDLLSPYLSAAVIDTYRQFGGVRLEDVVLVTSTGIVNFTLCPRTIEEVEFVMAGGKWPPIKDEAPELRRARLTDPVPLPSPPSR